MTTTDTLDQFIERIQNGDAVQLMTVYHADAVKNDKPCAMLVYFGENDELLLEVIDTFKRKAKRSQR